MPQSLPTSARVRTNVRELVSDGTTVDMAFFLMVPVLRLDTADGAMQITHTRRACSVLRPRRMCR